MNKNIMIKVIVVICPLFILTSYNACSQFGFGDLEPVSENWSALSSEVPIVEGKNSMDVSLLSAEQVLKSMGSLTDVENDNSVLTEYNQRNAMLASEYNFNLMNSPMWLVITNLAFAHCNVVVNREASMLASDRKFFPNVGFENVQVLASSINDQNYKTAINHLAFRFWGRELSEEESRSLMEAKDEFIQSNQKSSLRDLSKFVCTGMLASLDSISL